MQIFGLPHDRLSEDICAWIKLRDSCGKLSEKEVKEYCKGKVKLNTEYYQSFFGDNSHFSISLQIAYFKIPKWVFFTNEFPISVSGKVQKFRLKELSCEILEKKKLSMAGKNSIVASVQ